MEKKILGLIVGFLFIGVNLFAADGDLIVNGSIGIGTTSPAAKLDVAGTDITGIKYIKSGSKDARIQIGDPTKTWGLAVGWGTAGDFSIIEEGVAGDRLYIKQGGNVGIGTTGPTIKLAIGDTDTGLNWAGDGLLDIYSNNVNTMSIRSGNVGIGTTGPTIKLAIGDTDTGLNWAGDGLLDIYSNNVNTMSIRSGNVGIGTTNPGSYKLYVSGTLNAAAYAVGGTNGLTLSAKFGCGNCGCGSYQICTLSWTNGILTGRSCSSDSGCR